MKTQSKIKSLSRNLLSVIFPVSEQISADLSTIVTRFLSQPRLVPFSVSPSGHGITKLHLIMSTSLKVEMHVFHVCDIPSTDRPFEIEMKLLKNCFPFSLKVS